MKRNGITKQVIILLIAFGFLMGTLFFSVRYFSTVAKQQETQLLLSSMERAIVQCYAMEGFYPAQFEYLVENDYLRIDFKKYNVYYECFASNVMPEYGVYLK